MWIGVGNLLPRAWCFLFAGVTQLVCSLLSDFINISIIKLSYNVSPFSIGSVGVVWGIAGCVAGTYLCDGICSVVVSGCSCCAGEAGGLGIDGI